MRSPDCCRRLGAPRQRTSVEFQQSIEDQVRRAIAHREFELHFQPIASITSGQIGALEALVRGTGPKKGRLTPALFLPPIERSSVSARRRNLAV